MKEHDKKSIVKSHANRLILWLAFTSSFLLGISFAYTYQWIIFSVFWFISIFITLNSSSWKPFFLCIIFFVLGFTRLQFQLYRHNCHASLIRNQIVNITGSVYDIDPVQHDLYHYTVLIDVTSTTNTKNNIPSRFNWRLQCYTKQKPYYTVGDTIMLQDIKIGKKNSNSFNTYLIKEGIHATTFLKNNKASILYHPRFHLKRSIHTFKHNILNQLQKKCSPNTITLLSSIFLGNRSCIKKQYQHIKNLFLNWGIIHYLARSGLHLIIFILLLQLILRYIPIPLLSKQLVTLLVTGFYALLTWPSISFSRAYTGFLWCMFCKISGLQINIVHTILMLICLFLFINPSLLFFLDFQLSFGLTLVLAITNSQLLYQK